MLRGLQEQAVASQPNRHAMPVVREPTDASLRVLQSEEVFTRTRVLDDEVCSIPSHATDILVTSRVGLRSCGSSHLPLGPRISLLTRGASRRTTSEDTIRDDCPPMTRRRRLQRQGTRRSSNRVIRNKQVAPGRLRASPGASSARSLAEPRREDSTRSLKQGAWA